MSNATPQPRPSRHRPAAALVLAAVERAQRHGGRAGAPVSARSVLDHLALRPRSADARVVRGTMRDLAGKGALVRSRSHGLDVFSLTPAGRRRLCRERTAGTLEDLPESPQHRAWRNARACAALEIARFRASLSEALADGAQLLEAEPPPHSDEWLVLGERLRAAARRVGSAWHCLHEWPEPGDALADVDEGDGPGRGSSNAAESAHLRALRAGRRNIRLWSPDTR